jgi:GTPase SAR1 family protein
MKGNVAKSKYKLVLLGDQHVGKTALINRFINNSYDQTYNVSILRVRPQSESTFSLKIFPTMTNTTDYSSGIRQGNSDLKVSFQAI